jgi:hypothetical protein
MMDEFEQMKTKNKELTDENSRIQLEFVEAQAQITKLSE